MVTTCPPKTIVKPTALGPVANTDTKLLIYGLFQKGRVLAQDEVCASCPRIQTHSKTRATGHRRVHLYYGERHHHPRASKGRGKNNYQVFVVIHLLQG